MKKVYALFIIALSCTTANAQIKKGEIVLGGNLGYSDQYQGTTISGTTSSNQSKNFSIAPSFGRAIKDNLVLGFDVGYNHSRASYSPTPDNTGNGGAADIFLRKYKPLGNGFYLFGQSSLGGFYNHSKQNDETGASFESNSMNAYGFTLQFFPGIAYALNQKWQLEAGLPNFFVIGWSHSKQTNIPLNAPEQDYVSHSFQLQSSITGSTALTIGLRYFIGG